MITYTVTRGELVLRYTPTFEGGYFSEASVDGGATFAPPERRTQEDVEGVVVFCRTQPDTVVEESDFIPTSKVELFSYAQLWDRFFIAKDYEAQDIIVLELDYGDPMWKRNGNHNAISLLLEINLTLNAGDVMYEGKDYSVYWSANVIEELKVLANRRTNYD